MQTKHVCVLIYIEIKGEAGTVKHIQALQYFFTDRSKAVLLLWTLFVVCVFCLSLFYCLVCFLAAL